MMRYYDEATMNSMARIDALMNEELEIIRLPEIESSVTSESGLRSVLAKIARPTVRCTPNLSRTCVNCGR